MGAATDRRARRRVAASTGIGSKALSRAERTAILKALADPRRFELLERIAKADCPFSCTDALEAMPIAAATLSHHIKELETAGLIEVRPEGKFHFLRLMPGVLQALAGGLLELEPDARPPKQAPRL